MKKRGFTLVELLIVISIISVLSVVGISLYSGVQKNARDAKRKSDLRSIKVALELYKQTNGRYPATEYNYLSSIGGGKWIYDHLSGVGATPGPGLDSNYFPNGVPVDPINKNATGGWGPSAWYWLANSPNRNSYFYAYWSGNCNGPFFVLIAQLENENDKDSNRNMDYKWCNGSGLYSSTNNKDSQTWVGPIFVVTSL